MVLRSHIENPDGLNHEFLHSVINPIVEKLSQKLIERQKEKISQMASDELKFNQNYGEGYFSLLCEEFIRAYNDFFRRGENPSTYTHEDFQREIADKKEKQFQEALAEEERLRVWCDKLGIKTLEDFRTKSKEYFEQFMKNRFEKNLLQDLIFKFYQEYVNRPDKNVNFEQFVLNNFANKI